MNRKGLNKAFQRPFQNSFGQSEEGGGDIPYALLKAARHNGQLNLSNRQLQEVPEKVWKINVDVPEEAKNVSMASNSDERWWDQVDMRKLILASNQLKEIPLLIQHLPALTVLDAHDNQIEKIAEEIGELKELTKLHLSHNKLSTFPQMFFSLSTIKILFLSGNEISELPQDFGYLCNIEELEISQNKLTKIPESFGNLTQLKRLDLSKNLITELPVGFECLSSLKDLNISSNKLTTLPAGFGKLTSLEIVEGRYNLISTIAKFTKTANIKQLFLGYNHIRELPDDVFVEFPKLVSLDLRDNSITNLPGSLINLKLLERIDLTNNNISGLPYAMGHMPLKALTLDGNPMRGVRRDIIARGTQAILEYLRSRLPAPTAAEVLPSEEKSKQSTNSTEPAANNVEEKICHQKSSPNETPKAVVEQYLIATTKVLAHNSGANEIPEDVWLSGAKIQNINFSKNTLTLFPDKIFQYSETLSELNVSANKLTTLPSEIGSLSKITFLDLSSNQLSSLPDEISVLPHLLQIVLSFNRFAVMPKSLFKMQKLQTLLIANNQIAEIDVDGLLELKTLQTLDLSNNSIARVPPLLGNVTWLKSLTLDGNAFRSPRPQIMMKGTQFILSYLRDRIPT